MLLRQEPGRSWCECDLYGGRNIRLVTWPDYRKIPGFVLHLRRKADGRSNPPVRTDTGIGQRGTTGNELLAHFLVTEVDLHTVSRRQPVVAPYLSTLSLPANPAADHNVKALAAKASLSTRQLTRLFKSELATTPARYVEMVRIDAARAALDAGRAVTEAAHLAGFGSAETLRRVFVTNLGVTPTAYRDRFRTTSRG